MTRYVFRMAALAVALCGWVGTAGAGDVQPVALISPQPVAPAALPEAAPATGGPIVVTGAVGGGCASCAPKHVGLHGHGLGVAIGAGCENPVTCGNCATEKTFLFGSCRQFYNPGYTCESSNVLGKCLHGQRILYGTGGLGDHNTCEYGSFNNR